jgi:hypothetical protein
MSFGTKRPLNTENGFWCVDGFTVPINYEHQESTVHFMVCGDQVIWYRWENAVILKTPMKC